MTSAADAALTALLEEGRAAGCFPMASAQVARIGDPSPLAVGHVGGAGADTLWDVASLTKPMAVVTAAMRGVSEGWLDLDAPIATAAGGAREVTARALLGHRSGLPAHVELYARLDAEVGAWADGAWLPGSAAVHERVRAWLDAMLDAAPAVPATIYSDLGYIWLGWWLERRLGRPLEAPVGAFAPEARERCAPTGWCPFRGRVLRGEVNDTNAWALGGVCGHAGIFATLAEVGAWAGALAAIGADVEAHDPVRAGVRGVDGAVVRHFWSRASRPPADDDGTWVLGWDTPSPGGVSTAGATVGAGAVGHLGFTGTSVWVDRDAGLVFTLLTNRVALGEGAQPLLRAFRPRFHDALRALARRGRPA